MAKREIPEINAGSMADIAFLLLIFWLVTTTMDRDQGVEHQLPQKLPPCETCPKVQERNVLDIKVNANDELLIEKNPAEVADVAEWVNKFYFSEEENLPRRFDVTGAIIADTLAKLDAEIAKAEIEFASDAVKKVEVVTELTNNVKEWNGFKSAHEVIGDFRAIHKRAVIRLETNNATTYKTYLAILDQIKGVLAQLRNEFSMEQFGMSYEQMTKDAEDATEEEKAELTKKIKAVRSKFPLRILEPDPRNT